MAQNNIMKILTLHIKLTNASYNGRMYENYDDILKDKLINIKSLIDKSSPDKNFSFPRGGDIETFTNLSQSLYRVSKSKEKYQKKFLKSLRTASFKKKYFEVIKKFYVEDYKRRLEEKTGQTYPMILEQGIHDKELLEEFNLPSIAVLNQLTKSEIIKLYKKHHQGLLYLEKINKMRK
mgnify:CR=1 FL=1